MTQKRRRRKPQGSSSVEDKEDPVDVLCRIFSWDANMITSRRNKNDPNMPFMYNARNLAEWERNETSLSRARGGSGVWDPRSALAPPDPEVKPKRRRRKNPPSHIPAPRVVLPRPQPDWDNVRPGPTPLDKAHDRQRWILVNGQLTRRRRRPPA